MKNRLLHVLLTPLLGGLFVLAGCSESGPPSLADYNNNNIKKLRAAYGMFVYDHGLKGPRDEEEFKKFLTTNSGAIGRMKRMGVEKENILDIFVSERDGKPFKIRYGLGGQGDFPAIFEAEGVNGKRMVAYVEPVELDTAEYDKAWSAEVKVETSMPAIK